MPRDADGIKRCPSGDYTSVRVFGSYCRFGPDCWFGPGCQFGPDCQFSSGCQFSSYCRLGPDCWFGPYCRFGPDCRFSSGCSFGPDCWFEDHKAKPGNPFIAIDRAGARMRKTYFFNLEPGIHVRSGCFFGTLEQFRAKVLEDCKPTDTKALQYLGMANIAAATFGGEIV